MPNKARLQTIFANAYNSDPARQQLMFRLLSLVLSLISFIMSGMNLLTREIPLLFVTAGYSALCLVVYFLHFKHELAAQAVFAPATLAMLSAFIITGIPEGFSVLWTLLIPGCTLYIFGIRRGTCFSAVTLMLILFFFWLPWGRGLLLYGYSSTFMMRFPLVYVCMYLISFYVEWIRMRTFQRMQQAEHSYRQLYRHDALTGLLSRHAFHEDAAQLCAAHDELETAVLMLDIDDFKAVNDRYGHLFGDEVLCKAAAVISENICEHCIACRWGGEEFLVMMRCRHSPFEVAERIRDRIGEIRVFTQDGTQIHFTVSIGVSKGKIDRMEQLAGQIDQADQALYASKKKGKNCTTVF